MKTTFLLVAAMAAGSVLAATDAKQSAVAVTFKDSDKFTDARSSFGSSTDQYYLDTLSDHLKKVAAKHLATGQKLEITITDVDLAGDFIPGNPNTQDVRIIKDIFFPRLALSFKLTGADGKVIKEGERKLSDMNFMGNISLIDRNQPLFYDKTLLSDWVQKEFKS